MCRGCDGTVTRFSTCGARLRGYSCFRLPHFGSVLNCQYRSIQVQVSIFQLSTIAALYKKRPRGVQRGAALCPFAVFSHSNVIYPLRGGRSLCAIQPEAAAYAAYAAEVPQPMRHIQPEFHNLCGIYGWVSAIYIMQQYILQKYTKFRLIYFGSVLNCRYRSIQAQVSFFQLSTIAALYKKGPGVCRGARPCAPLRFSHIPM